MQSLLPLQDCQILTRYCRADLPYWKSFFHHHIRLGVSRFVVCIQTEDEISEFKHSYCQTSDVSIVVLKTPSNLLPSVALRSIDLAIILHGPAYTLMIDSDEFFCLGVSPVNEFRQLIQTRHFINLPWMMNCLLSNDTMKGFWGHASKPLALTKAIKCIRGDHVFGYRTRSKLLSLSGLISRQLSTKPSGNYSLSHVYRLSVDAYLIHYWGRSFNDVLIRGLFSRFRSAKQSDQDQLVSKMIAGIIPNRFKIYAYLLLHPASSLLPFSFPSNGIDLAHEVLVLADLGVTSSMRDDLASRFYHYLESLTSDTFGFPLYPSGSIPSLQQVISNMPDKV